MNQQIALTFLLNEAGEDEGLGHAGIETYRDSPYASIARECGQNSRDEAVQLPVEMRFDVIRIPKSQYPLLASQTNAVAQCLAKARAKKDDKEIDFFERASEVLAQDQIVLLKIDDRNTKGLVGPAVAGKPFHSLVKATGVSQKDSATSGGSFGIGKNAAFAASELQTVFYSTTYSEPSTGQAIFLAQGKTILVSHTSVDGKERRGTGYWGMSGFMPIEEKDAVPSWLRRDAVGTSVVVAGFRWFDGWQYRIAASLIQNFFCGIHRGEIKFILNDGEIEISQVNLATYFEHGAIVKAAEEADGGEEFKVARNLYECLTSPESLRQTLEIEGIGPVSLAMLMKDGFPKRVQIIRNGMSITDELGSFGDKFASFPRYRDFVALVEPANPDGNKLFKRLENPRHDALSAERLSDPIKRAAATRSMKKLAKAIRQAIKSQALTKPEPIVDLSELSEYFDVPEGTDVPPSPSTEENPQHLTYTPAPPRQTRVEDPGTARQGKGGAVGYGRSGRGDGTGRGSRRGRGTGGKGINKGDGLLDLTDVRNVRVDAVAGYSRRLYFTPVHSCKASIEVRAVGVDTPSMLNISAADQGSLENGKLIVDVTAEKRFTAQVKFSVSYTGPIELLATRIGAEAS